MNEFEKSFAEGKIYFRCRYNRYPAVQLEFRFPSLTEQHHKDDCDVNIILNRYMKTGVLSHTSSTPPVYGDFTGTPTDYASAVKLLQDAKERFASLPSAIRERFGNDPLQLLQFLDNPANASEAADLGLIDRPKPEVKSPEGVTAEGGNEA